MTCSGREDMIFIIVMTQERPVIFRLLPRPWSSLQRQRERERERDRVAKVGWWVGF